MITDYDIEQKADELLAEYIADDSFLGDALCDCYAEVRAIVDASTSNIDDKISAIDNFTAKLEAKIKRRDVLNAEAYDFLKNQMAWG